MKKLIGMTFVALFMMSMANNSLVIKTTPCQDAAANFVEAYEETHGCQDAETANWIYETIHDLCEFSL